MLKSAGDKSNVLECKNHDICGGMISLVQNLNHMILKVRVSLTTDKRKELQIESFSSFRKNITRKT